MLCQLPSLMHVMFVSKQKSGGIELGYVAGASIVRHMNLLRTDTLILIKT